MTARIRYAVLKGLRDFLVAGLGTAAITYAFREATGGDPAELPTFVAVLAVWRVVRDYLLAAATKVLDAADRALAPRKW